MKRITAGLMAHVDAGKTTLSEALLYQAGEIRKQGRVDHGDAFLDTEEEERNRGITIFSKQAILHWKDTEITLLDTPGHVDFAAETERSISVMDYAILLISANEGVTPHTVLLWRLLEKQNVPVVIFVNKMDLSIRKRADLMPLLREKLSDGLVDMTWQQAQISREHVILAEDEEEYYLDQMTLAEPEFTEDVLEEGEIPFEKIQNAVASRKLFPCFFGSALKMEGVQGFLDAFTDLTEAPLGQEDAAFGGRVFKIARGDRNERIVFLKITQGTLRVKDEIATTQDGGLEKVNQIRIYSGKKFQTVDSAGPGTIVGVIGLNHAEIGMGLGQEEAGTEDVLEPVLSYAVEGENTDAFKLSEILKILAEEDPKLHYHWDPEKGRNEIRLMGEIQKEVLSSRVMSRFGIQLHFQEPRILYRETIQNTVEGMGHFEPLRHYAEVHLLLEPLERGVGLIFDTDVREDDLDRNWQRLIMTHLEERVHTGVLLNAPITDMKITIVGGRAHKKHTEGGDFRQATYRALRQGLRTAESVLLEPWMYFSIRLPQENLGRAMTDLNTMSGTYGEPGMENGNSVLEGKAPASELLAYQKVLTGYTGGRGVMSLANAGYELCHNPEEVMERVGYNPDRDVDNPADSVFTSHGGSEIIPWQEAPSHMHVASYLETRKINARGYDMEEEIRRQRERRKSGVQATDKELMAIFETTYGPMRRRLPQKTREVDSFQKPPEAALKDAVREAEIREKHRKQQTSSPASKVQEWLVVDGYNMIHADEELSNLSKRDFGAARQKLLEQLLQYGAYRDARITVIFDAYHVKGNAGHEEDFHGMKVVFTKEKETADTYIERLTTEAKDIRYMRVVSSDAQIQQIALGHGALRSSAREFAAELREMQQEIRGML